RVAGALSGMESRGAEADAEAASRLSELAGSHEQLNSAVERLQEQVSAARTDFGDMASQEEDRATRIDEELHELQARLGKLSEGADERVADALAAMESRGAKADAEAAARLSELAGSHEQLAGAMVRLEEQVSAARADLGSRTSGESEQTTRLERHLGDVKDLLAGVAARIDDEAERAREAGAVDAGFEKGLADLREHVDARLVDVLARLETSAPGRDDDASQLSDLAGGQEQLRGAIARLDEQVTAALAEPAGGPSPESEQATRLEQHLGDVKELLAGVAARVDDEAERAREAGAADAGFEKGLADLREHVDARLEDVLARLETSGPGRDDDGASQLSDLAGGQEQLKSAIARLEKKLSAVPVDTGSATAKGKKPAPGVQRQLAAVSEQLAALGARIENDVQPVLASLQGRDQDADKLTAVIEQVDKRVADALSGLEGRGGQVDGEASARLSELAGSHEQLNTAVGRLEEQVSVALAGLGSPTLPDEGQAAGVEQQLANVSEQLAALGARIANDVEPVLAVLQQREQDDGIEKSLADLRAQLSTITEHVDKRVADALSELDGRAVGSGADAAAPKSKAGPKKQPAPAAAGAARPAGKTGPTRLVAALIDAINSGDPKLIRKFVAAEYSESALMERRVKDRVDVYMSFHEEAGEVVLCHVEDSEAEEIVAVVQETDSPQRHKFALALDPTPPHKIYVVNIDRL
ncbi:MAG: coiled-coil domain-containing protein, partial [Planctomycetota bacterium]